MINQEMKEAVTEGLKSKGITKLKNINGECLCYTENLCTCFSIVECIPTEEWTYKRLRGLKVWKIYDGNGDFKYDAYNPKDAKDLVDILNKIEG
jgi:hypothetical protein